MDKDIVPELAKAIDESFKLKTKESRVLKDKLLRLKKKMANHEDSSQFAKELGDILADAFKDNLKDGVLPDGKMYYNIADRLINPRLKENYNIINDYGKEVQTSLNKDAGISIKAIDSGYNEDKVRGIVNYVSNSDKYEDAADTFYSSIENFSMSVIDNLIRSNADFHYKAGLSPKIIRKSNGHCCDWCSNLVGVYDYKDVKDNGNAVFRRHRHCDCTVIYDPRDGGKKRNVHTHKDWTDPDKNDKIKERIKLSEKEQSNKGLNRETRIDKKKIFSNDYDRKFNSLGENKRVTKELRSKSKEILRHRDGTKFEDLVFVDSKTGRSLVSNKFNVENTAFQTKEMKKMIKSLEEGRVIAIHNHPGSLFPSVDDLNVCYNRKYKYGLVIAHNGEVFKYSVNNNFDMILYNIVFNKIGINGYSEEYKNELTKLGISIEVLK